jgi:ABC-2 type transport system ATP-binding protein
MSQVSSAICTTDLRKEYGAKVAVESLTLAVEPGEIFGFLGPNGAGKTTSVKMLLGLVRPTSGEALILGTPVQDPRCRQKIGFLPEDFRFHDWLSGVELLELHARLLGMSKEDRATQIPELLEMVGLADAAQRTLSTYSKGMQQRIGLAQALLNEPKVVFLDEPTSGLDPLGRRLVRRILARLREQGVTVFLNSHFLSEVEITCTRVAFVSGGRVRLITDPHAYRDGLLSVRLRVGSIDDGLVRGLAQWSKQVHVSENSRTLSLQLPNESALPEIARWIAGRGTDLYEISPQALSLEELFVQVVEDRS